MTVQRDRRGTEHFAAPCSTWSVEELREAVLEGSGKALEEWMRRGLEVPTVDRPSVWMP